MRFAMRVLALLIAAFDVMHAFEMYQSLRQADCAPLNA